MECLNVLKSNMNSKHQDIAGIPLQCLLIGEVYEDDAITYADLEDASFPTIVASSITELYTAMVAKKFNKYRVVHRVGDTAAPIDNDILMNMHARFSVELIFPEHFGKLQHLFGPVQLEDILKVGILESTGVTSALRFVHRTFAEYFVAWFFVNHLGSQDLSSIFVESVFSCHDTFSNSVGVDSFAFVNPVVGYFIDSLITDTHYFNTYDIRKSLNSEGITRRIVHACVNADFVKLFQLFLRMNIFEKHEKVIFDKDVLLLALEKSSLDLVKVVLGMFEKHQNFDLATRTLSLRVAVRRGDYCIVEYLINEMRLRSIIEEGAEELNTILHDCVSESRSNSAKVIEQKIEVVRLINAINPGLMEEINMKGQTPLLCKHVHLQIMIELIHLGGNVLVKGFDHDTVLHFTYGGRDLSSTDFHLLLSYIPLNELKSLAQMKGKHDRTPLASLLAATDPAPETLVKFMDAGADFNYKDVTGSSILEIAIKKGRDGKTLNKIIECGAEVINWRTVLHIAAWFGNLDAAVLFLNSEQRLDVNSKDGDGFTSLDYALQSDFDHGKRLETGMALHAAGGNLKEFVNPLGQTWFHLSAHEGNIQSIQLLLNIGIDVNIVDQEGNIPLHSLTMNWDSLKSPILELLLEHKANLSLFNRNKESPFHFALKSDQLDIETFKLLKLKTNVEWTQSLANSAMNILIKSGSDLSDYEFNEIAKEMEGHGADFIFKDDHGNSLLHIAIENNHVRAIKLLLNKQDVNIRNDLQQTPLHLVTEKQLDSEVTKLLIEAGGDVNAKDKNNKTFHHSYIIKGPTVTDLHSMVMYLARKNLGHLFNIKGGEYEATPVQIAVGKLELQDDTLSLLNSSGADFNATNNDGTSVLGYAVGGKVSVTFLSRLIRYGADWKALTDIKCNMLHLSAQHGTVESLKFFLDFGELDMNAVAADGDTPIHCAAIQEGATGVLEKCKLLMEQGADVNIINAKGLTPLQYAQSLRTDGVQDTLKCLIAENNKLTSQMVVEGEEDQCLINLETIKHVTGYRTNVFEWEGKNRNILHKFLSKSNSPSSSAFHSVSEYLIGKNLSNLLNTPGGRFESTPFQEAVRALEIESATLSLLHSNFIDFNAVDKEGESVLFYAVRGKRSTKFISSLIDDYGVDVMQLNNHKESLLHCAVHNGTAESLDFFLNLGTLDVNGKNKEYLSPLNAFVRSGEGMFEAGAIQKYRLLVDHGADINSSNNVYHTPLHSSTYFRKKDASLTVIKHLVEDGANIYAKDSYKRTFLHFFIFNEPRPTPSDFHGIVEYLNNKGCIGIFNEESNNGTTPVVCAVRYLEPKEETLSILRLNDISFSDVDRDGNTILIHAVEGRRSENFIYILVTRFGVSPRNLNSNGDNLLHLLARYYRAEALQFFLESSLPGLDVNGKDKDGRTPLLQMVQLGSEDLLQKCKLLISHGADVNIRCNLQQTPLHVAVLGKVTEISLKTVKYLIEEGADVSVKNQHNYTFLHSYFSTNASVSMTSPSQVHSLTEFLLGKDFARLFNTPGGKYEQTPLQSMIQYLEPKQETLSLLHSRGVNFNAVDKNGNSLLTYAIKGGRSSKLLSNLVIQFGANHKCVNHFGESILHTASSFGTVETLNLFLDLGECDINGQATNGDTPLICAVHPENRKTDVVDKTKLLVSKGSHVSIANNDGQTPLGIVMKFYDGTDKGELAPILQLVEDPDPMPRSPYSNTSDSAKTNAE